MTLCILLEMTEEMLKRLGEVICIAPWTELDLSGDEKKKKEKKKKHKGKYKVRTE